MKYAQLGTSGMHVSRICLGTMLFGTPRALPECVRLVSEAMDRGINFFDTANVYEVYSRAWGSSGGVAEEILGTDLEGRRQKEVICTKIANPNGVGPDDADLSARHLERELELSLKRLRTDRIDLG